MAKIPSKISKIIDSITSKPGVYLMKSAKRRTIYIGKAASLKKRVRSHFFSASSKRGIFLREVEGIDYIECDTEEQALFLEASLIKEKKPKYNVALRDDKSYPFVGITADKFPRVFIFRPKKIAAGINNITLIGPYPKVKLLKSSLALLREVFPYRSCAKMPKKACLYFHLRLCPAPCIGKIPFKDYRKNIYGIYKVLNGERKRLISHLNRRMKEFSSRFEFEAAETVKNQILSIGNLYSGKAKGHSLFFLKECLGLAKVPIYIEAIDISSLSGKEAVGSLVVFKAGVPDKSSYRRFKIKGVKRVNDYAMAAEVVKRRYLRLLNKNLALPDLIVIDGGLGHVDTVEEELNKLGLDIPLIGIAKRNEEVWFPQRVHRNNPLRISKDNPCLHLIQRVRDEAHRFAHNYHTLLRKKKKINI